MLNLFSSSNPAKAIKKKLKFLILFNAQTAEVNIGKEKKEK